MQGNSTISVFWLGNGMIALKMMVKLCTKPKLINMGSSYKIAHVYQHQKSVMHLLGEEKYNFVKTNMTFFKAE